MRLGNIPVGTVLVVAPPDGMTLTPTLMGRWWTTVDNATDGLVLRLMKAPILLAFLGLATAQAAEPTGTLTLACEGTVTIDDWSLKRAGQPQEVKPKPYSMEMTINLTARTVQGFGAEYPFKITNMNAGTIIFRHSNEKSDVLGHIDRVTGDLDAQIKNWLDVQRHDVSNEQIYEMKCKPT